MKSSLLKKSFSNHYEIISSVFSDDTYEGFQAKRFEKLQLLKLIHKKTKALEDLQNDSLLSFQFSLLKGLDHPHLVKLYDFGLDDETGKLYYTQEWIEGFSLLESISSLTTQNLLSLFKQCLDALAYLHSQKIIHGHIKPENILIQKDNSNNLKVKLTDYGILGRSLEKCKISPFYHSPEEVLGEALLPQSDLFSLASVFYMALQKKAPFLEERAQLKQALEPIHLKNPEVDLYYSLLLSKMLEINPQYRISSAEACLDYIKSQGDEASISPWPINFKKEWVGRDEIGKSCVQFLKRVTEDPKRYQCLLIVGEKELSSSALLSEMKYVAEQMGVSVCLPGEKNSDQASVFFLDSTGENPQSSLEFNSSSIIWAMPPDQSERIIQELAAFKPEAIRLRSLNRVEINQYLQKILQISKIPSPLLEALYQFSAGIPSYLFEAIEAFYGHYSKKFKNKIWDLSFFETNPPDPISLCLNPESIDRLLRTGCIKSDEERWELELFQVDLFIQEKKLEKGLKKLSILESRLDLLEDQEFKQNTKIKILEKRAFIFSKQNKFEELRQILTNIFSSTREKGDISQNILLQFKNLQAYLALQEGRPHEAVAQFEASNSFIKSLSLEERSKIRHQDLGAAYLMSGRIDEAISCLKEEVRFYQETSNCLSLIKCNYNLGEGFLASQSYEAAIQCYEKVVVLARQNEAWDFMLRAYHSLGNVYSLNENLRASEDYYQRAFVIAQYLKEDLSAAVLAQNRGVILKDLDRYAEAVEELDKSYAIASRLSPSVQTQKIMMRLAFEQGEIARVTQNLDQAKKFLQESIRFIEKEPQLKSFRFYPLISLAQIAIQEKDFQVFRHLAPQLGSSVKTEEQKILLQEVMKKADVFKTNEEPPSRSEVKIQHQDSLELQKKNQALEQELIEAKNKILNLEKKLAYEKSETSQPHLAKETSLEEKDITLNDKKIEQSLYRSDWTWQKLEEAYFAYMLIKYKRDYPIIAEAMGVGIATVYVKLRKFGFKNDLNGWEENEFKEIEMPLEDYKAQVIRECYEQNKKSPYATAKQLNLNIGTIYRFLKNDLSEK